MVQTPKIIPLLAPGDSDFIVELVEWAEVRSPHIFKLWTAISMVAASLERRVYTKTRFGEVYANLYVMLVGPPGVGKKVIEIGRALMRETMELQTNSPAFKMASDSASAASLMDEMVAARSLELEASGPRVQHCITIMQEEFQVFLPTFAPEMMGRLNALWNNKPLHSETRRTGAVRELSIENPQLNMLCGAQPAYLALTFPEEAWATGLARRMVMVYSAEMRRESLWGEEVDLLHGQRTLLARLAKLRSLRGYVRWTPEAMKRIDEWQLTGGTPGCGGDPTPTHSKLQHYNRSRDLHIIKLAIVSSVSRSSSLIIEAFDVERAMAWLFEAETLMPEVFRDMVGRSDNHVIEETHLFITSTWARAKQKPVNTEQIMQFLISKVPHDKAHSLLMSMKAAGIVANPNNAPDLWIPRPRHEHLRDD